MLANIGVVCFLCGEKRLLLHYKSGQLFLIRETYYGPKKDAVSFCLI